MASAPSRRADAALVSTLIGWYDAHERPLPWRSTSPWGVLVSEFMLQQTPVERVLPLWDEWMRRWPTPPDLAAASLADALRAWGRLGYPRRARWLHQSAVIITRQHDGVVPSEAGALRDLPGVGEYTSAAVMAFAFGQRSVVLDTNVRRVVARAVTGVAAAPAHITSGERDRAEALWPTAHQRSARWSAAVMEFGAVVCRARRPSCDACPIRRRCAWTASGQPDGPAPRRTQAEYAGSDRQARGCLMALLRERHGALPMQAVLTSWPDATQASRALEALIADGLVERLPRGLIALPT